MATARSTKSTDEKDLAELQAQMDQLKNDVSAIAASLTGIGSKKVDQAKTEAEKRYQTAVDSGEELVEDIQKRAKTYENEFEAMVREKPLTALAGAVGVGFVAALLFKR